MEELPDQNAVMGPPAGQAQVVFLRPSGLGFAIQSSVFEIQEGKPTLLGIIAAKKKLACPLPPGAHLFMVIGENADFMSADLLPDKTYYVLDEPRMGFWKARFSLEPVPQKKLGGTDLTDWLGECRWVRKVPDADNWMQANIKSIMAKYNDYYADWVKKPDADKPTLLPGDGK